MNRRAFLASSIAGLATGLRGAAEPESISVAERDAMEAVAVRFLKKHDVPGLSVAIAVDGQFVYADGFGYANKATKETVTSQHLFRVASVSKTFTSVTIMRLLEDGKIRLADRVLGPKACWELTMGSRHTSSTSKMSRSIIC